MADQIRLISFQLGPDSFVIDLMSVRQIIAFAGVIPVPTAPSFVEGIVVHRDQVVPVIDLRARLYPDLPVAEQSLLMLTVIEDQFVALKVDEVRRILTINSETLLVAPDLIRESVKGNFVVGVVEFEEKVFLALDVDRVLSGDEQEKLRSVRWETPDKMPAEW